MTEPRWHETTSPAVDGKGYYVFLDIDGVLWDNVHMRRRHYSGVREHGGFMTWASWLDTVMVARLSRLMDALGPAGHLVLSSSWRKYVAGGLPKVQAYFEFHGFTHCFQGMTPNHFGDSGSRGGEIKAWMDRYGVKPEQIVILDDDSDMGDLLPRLVRTTQQILPGHSRGGLQRRHVKEALLLLGVSP